MKKAPPTVAIEATIGELAPGGDGVAIVDVAGERRAIFARGVAVGDRVRLDVDMARRPARGRVLEIVEPGADRVTPACAWVDRCGGCDWMHVSLEAQRRAHVAHVRAALPAAWDVPIAMHAEEDALGYRGRARLHARASGGRAIVGMNESASNEPVEVETCAVLAPAIDRARSAIAALLEGAHGRGDAQVAMGRTAAGERPVLELTWGGALPAAVYARLERAVSDGEWAGARVACGEASRPAIVGDPTPWMTGGDGAPLRLSAGGFGQASERMNARLAARVAELARAARGADAPTRVAELYAGAGNLTVMLADGAEVTAVEASRDACDAARANLAARGLAAKVVEADASRWEWGRATRLVVLDPPRTGARDVAARLTRTPVRHVIYVSCDPQTLGRDLALLAEHYAPVAVDAFEMFAQTSHVETVVALARRRSKGAA